MKKLKDIHTLITIEEHFIDGGLGSIISEWIVKKGVNLRLKKLGIKNEFIHEIKNVSGMRKKYGISSDKIQKTIKEAFKYEKVFRQ
jgi:transketolase